MDNLNVPAPLSDADYAEVMSLLDQVALKVAPFNIPLDAHSLKRLSPLGERSEGYVDTAEDAASKNAASLGAAFSVSDFDKAHKTFEQADAIEDRLLQILVGPHNTALVAGSVSKKFADNAYKLFKGLARLNAKFQTIVDDLAERYKSQGGSSPNPPGNTP